MATTDSKAETARSLSTVCVHGRSAGRGPGGAPVVTPLVHSATFHLDDEAYALRAAGRSRESRVYTRETNPTIESVEDRLAALEGAEAALLFASGTAAAQAVLLGHVQRGTRVLAATDLYGGTRVLLEELCPRLGASLEWVDIQDVSALSASLERRPSWVFIESISNPTLVVADVPRIAEAAHTAGARVAIDATFATPVCQRPLELGADVVVHSATKYLSGHSDVVAGVLAGSAEVLDPCGGWRTRGGACADPQAAFLVERGLKTLALRVAAQCEGARQIAEFLAGHDRVVQVLHPSLPTHPSHATGARVLDDGGAMVSFVVRGGDAGALALLRRLELFAEAASLGGVESLASLPSNMSHVGLSESERASAGISPGFVRLSIGIEDPADLVADLERALSEVRA